MSNALEMEIKLKGHNYRVTRLNVFDQMQVAADFHNVLMGLAALKQNKPPELKDKAFEEAINFIITSPAGVTPEARQRVMNTCFKTISRQADIGVGVGWQLIQTADGQLMFDDIQLPESVALMYVVFEHNKLLDFFVTSPSPSTTGQKTEKVEGGPHSRKAAIG